MNIKHLFKTFARCCLQASSNSQLFVELYTEKRNVAGSKVSPLTNSLTTSTSAAVSNQRPLEQQPVYIVPMAIDCSNLLL